MRGEETDDMLSCFNRIPERDGHTTDGWTDIAISMSRVSVLTDHKMCVPSFKNDVMETCNVLGLISRLRCHRLEYLKVLVLILSFLVKSLKSVLLIQSNRLVHVCNNFLGLLNRYSVYRIVGTPQI